MAEAVVAVAASGGRDSLGLLHATLRAAHRVGVRVVALHVHHGLLAEADGWATDLERQCVQWTSDGFAVEFVCTRLSGAPAPGDSVEAWARRERYAALGRMARAAGATLVLLGHHRRDQAETVLLQALRGAGAAGLAGMPRVIERDGLTWARPWLEQGDAAIDGYVETLQVAFARDPSNADPRFARSRLRMGVMPALRTAFPDAENALLAVARHAQEARAVLAEVGLQDLAQVEAGEELVLEAWRALSPARRANALRAWLARHDAAAAPDTLVRRLLQELGDDGTRRWPLDGERGLRSWRGRLALVGHRPSGAALAPTPALALSLLRCATYAVPGWIGRLEVSATAHGGVAPHRLAQVLARARAGGERFQLQPTGAARGLKKQYQAIGIAAEGRDGPLLYDSQGQLLFAPGLGVDARAWAGNGAPQWALRWRACVPGEG